ncbi:MAG: ABC transporter permease [Bacteroidota bacterium]|jgi:ABC-2 type transport system permease protein
MKNNRNNRFIAVAGRELTRMFSDKVYLFIGLIAPVIGFGMIAWIFSANVPRDLPVAIADLDHTSLSRQIARTVDATSIARVDRSYTDLLQASEALAEGKADAAICIPENTERNILRGQNAPVAVYLNNAWLIKSGLLKSGIQKSLGSLSAGLKIRVMMMNGDNEKQAVSKIMAVRLRPVLLFNPYTSYEYYLTLLLLPVLLTVFVLFGTIYSVGSELQYGSGTEWLVASGGKLFPAVTGKLLPHTLVFSIQAIAMNILFFKVLGLPLNGHLGLIMGSELLMILAYQFMAILFVSVMKNMRLALSIASAYTMLAVTYAGLTFPLFGMPAIAQVFSRIFPFSYWLELFTGQTIRGEPVANALIRMLFISVFILAGALFTPRLKYIVSTRKYWGKI